MPDKTYAKVVLNGTTYVDLTSDTVDPSTLLAGYTAHDRSGALITGTFDSSIFVLKAGDTMTGPLILSGAPTENLHAATKKYVDDTEANYLPLTGGTLTGALTLSGDPTNSYHAVPKTYVDEFITSVSLDCLHKDGGTMTGALILNADPTVSMQAATKKYVDDSVAGYLPLTGGILTGGYLIIKDTHLSSGSASAYLTLGNNVDSSSEGSSFGVLNLYGTGVYKSSIRPTTLTDNRQLYFPDKDGTLAVTSDLDSYVLKTGDSLTGALSFYDGNTLKSKISNTELQINGHDLLRMAPHFAQMFATAIPANANLNTTTYLKCGQYYCLTTYGFVNSPTGNQFVMEVNAMIHNRYDDESGTEDAYRIRKITDYVGNQFIQYCTKPANGSWSYGAWKLYITGSKVGTLATASGTTLDESYCQQYGRTVNIRAWITGLSTSTQIHENIITVQLVDMPTTPVRFVFTSWLNNGIAGYAGYGSMATNGKITLVKPTANSNKVSFEFTYNV